MYTEYNWIGVQLHWYRFDEMGILYKMEYQSILRYRLTPHFYHFSYFTTWLFIFLITISKFLFFCALPVLEIYELLVISVIDFFDKMELCGNFINRVDFLFVCLVL